MSADEVDGPGAAEVAPKYFNNAPEKIAFNCMLLIIKSFLHYVL